MFKSAVVIPIAAPATPRSQMPTPLHRRVRRAVVFKCPLSLPDTRFIVPRFPPFPRHLPPFLRPFSDRLKPFSPFPRSPRPSIPVPYSAHCHCPLFQSTLDKTHHVLSTDHVIPPTICRAKYKPPVTKPARFAPWIDFPKRGQNASVGSSLIVHHSSISVPSVISCSKYLPLAGSVECRRA